MMARCQNRSSTLKYGEVDPQSFYALYYLIIIIHSAFLGSKVHQEHPLNMTLYHQECVQCAFSLALLPHDPTGH